MNLSKKISKLQFPSKSNCGPASTNTFFKLKRERVSCSNKNTELNIFKDLISELKFTENLNKF